VEFKDLVKSRYACRNYLEKPVPDEAIQELLEIARYSASGVNLQPWKIKVVADQPTKDKLGEASHGQAHVKNCSHLLVLCAETDYDGLIDQMVEAMKAAGAPEEQRSMLKDMATTHIASLPADEKLRVSEGNVYIMLGNIINGATSLGLASCPIGAFDLDEVTRILGLPKHVVPTIIVTVGYPADQKPPKSRYPLQDILI
jgi:nitroreductase